MREHKYHVFAAARLVATVSSTLLKTPEGAVTAGGRLRRLPGNHPNYDYIVAFSRKELIMFRYSGSVVTSPLDQRSGLQTPVSREQEYSPIAGGDASFDASIDSLPGSSAFGDLRRSQTADHHGPESQQLSPNDMIAPASAVHSMSVNLLDNNHVGSNKPSRDMKSPH
jgi:hypothetical protein